MDERQVNRRDFWQSSGALMALPLASGQPLARRVNEPADGTYAQSHEVIAASRWLFVSGQVPATADGTVPPRFDDQCRLAWSNVRRQLEAAGMSYEHLVKVTVFLAHRRHRDAARQIRQEMLGTLRHPPALTVVVVGIYDSTWLLEIEAVAVD
jgi:2-iminobutanoate/2-iminopropanoate deaminase